MRNRLESFERDNSSSDGAPRADRSARFLVFVRELLLSKRPVLLRPLT